MKARIFTVAIALAFDARRITRDIDAVFEPKSEVYSAAREVADRLESHGSGARVIGLKLRYHNFRTITRQKSLPEPTRDAEQIKRSADRHIPFDRVLD